MTAADTAEAGTAVSVFTVANPLVILTDGVKFDRFYEDVKRETDKLEIDLTTERGRKAIASMAYKVAQTKAAIDEAGKTLTAEWRDKINVVDEARRNIRTRLDALKIEVRKPLTEWEEAEEAREATVSAILAFLRNASVVMAHETAEDVAERLSDIRARILDPAVLQGAQGIAENLRDAAVDTLGNAHARLIKEAEDRAELELLRTREAERLARQEAEREEAEKATREAAEAERAALAAAHAKEVRKANEEAIAKRAAEAARAEAERQHAEALATEKRRADEAEAAQRAEAKRIADEQAAREAEAERLAAEQAARDKDRKHRGEVMSAAKVAIMALDVAEDAAKKIVLAIVAGEVPNVTLRF
jgi:colicin import membrane protein